MNLMEEILSPKSLARAAEEVEDYRWTTGVNAENRPTVMAALEPLAPSLVEAVRNRKYKPLPLFWERTKVTGKTTGAHALLMFDCTLQQAVYDRVFPIIEPLGAQPYAQDELADPTGGGLDRYLSTCLSAAGSGCTRVLAIDARLGYDDRMSGRIAQQLHEALPDRALVSLVSKYLAATAKAQANLKGGKGRVTHGPLHHLLQEIVLLPLCGELESRSLPYARKSGKLRVFLKSPQKADRLASSFGNLMRKSYAFDREDFGIAHVAAADAELWGYAIRPGEAGPALGMHENAVRDFKHELETNTARSYGAISNRQRAALVSATVRRYARHFRYADDIPELPEIDEWLCRRIRMDYLKRWKTPKGKINGLMSFGISQEEAKIAGSTHLGWWAASDMITLRKALARTTLRAEGYLLPLEAFEKHRAQPPVTR